MKIEIKHRFMGKIIYEGEHEYVRAAVVAAVKSGADLSGADLSRADLSGADLSGADLSRAYLSGADLSRVKGYRDSHTFFTECIRREKMKRFSESEWSFIAQTTIHSLCWCTIKKRFQDVATTVFDKLADSGFVEWRDYFKKNV